MYHRYGLHNAMTNQVRLDSDDHIRLHALQIHNRRTRFDETAITRVYLEQTQAWWNTSRPYFLEYFLARR